jgi:hypothetical protein
MKSFQDNWKCHDWRRKRKNLIADIQEDSANTADSSITVEAFLRDQRPPFPGRRPSALEIERAGRGVP